METKRKVSIAQRRNGMNEEETKELYRVVKACNTEKPDPDDLAALRGYLRSDPTLWRELADMASVAVEALAQEISGNRVMMLEAINRGREAMLEELGYAEASGLEKTLCEAVHLAWLRYTDTERRLTALSADGYLSTAQGEYWEKRVTASQRRYLRAAETLARIRKLQLPMLQVNIGQQQVNVAKGQ